MSTNEAANPHRLREELAKAKRLRRTYIDDPSPVAVTENIETRKSPVSLTHDENVTIGTVWPFVVYQIFVCLPFYFDIGTLHLPPYKLYLAFMLIPCFIITTRSKISSFCIADAMIVSYAFLASLSILFNNGASGTTEAIGSIIAETVGGYFMARAFVNSVSTFLVFVKTQIFLVIIIGLFSFYEAATSENLFLLGFGKVFKVFAYVDIGARLGLHRAQAVFEHPILNGIYCSLAFGLCFYVLQSTNSLFQRSWRLVLIVAATFVSLSSGAYISLASQICFIFWDKFMTFTKYRWRLLLALTVLTYFVVDGLSNRTPFEVFITYLTFDANSAYNRVLIWKYGSAEVWRHPLLGMGMFDDWIRARWMGTSIDNFLLLRVMRHGIPAALFFVGSVLWIVVKLSTLKTKSLVIAQCRSGLLVIIGGLVVSLTTVDLWSATYSLFCFLLGCSVWMIQQTTIKTQVDELT